MDTRQRSSSTTSPPSSPSPSSRTPTPSRMSSPFRYAAADPQPLLQRIGPPVPDPYAGDSAVDDELEEYDDDEDYEEGVLDQGRLRSASLDPIKWEDDLEIKDEDIADAAPFFPRAVNSPTSQPPRAPMPPPATALAPPPPPAAPMAVRNGEPTANINASLQVIATVTAPGHIVSVGVVAVSLAIAIAAAWALSFIF